MSVDIEVTSGDGTRLAVRTAGCGMPVVMVHGSGGGLHSWDPITDQLTDEFEVWVYARRGYLPSGAPVGPKTLADDVEDLRALIAGVGRPPHVVGGSYGAIVALQAVVHRRVEVRSLALFEPPLYAGGPRLEPVLDRQRQLVGAGHYATAAHHFAKEVALVPVRLLGPAPQAAADREFDSTARAEADGLVHDLEAMVASEMEADLWRNLEVPLLLMQGEQTWAPMPETMDKLAATLGSSVRRATLAGHNHFAPHTGPKVFADHLRGFFRHIDIADR